MQRSDAGLSHAIERRTRGGAVVQRADARLGHAIGGWMRGYAARLMRERGARSMIATELTVTRRRRQTCRGCSARVDKARCRALVSPGERNW
jgi:hypothetical protein